LGDKTSAYTISIVNLQGKTLVLGSSQQNIATILNIGKRGYSVHKIFSRPLKTQCAEYYKSGLENLHRHH
jgi:hypothetical protein